MHLTRKYYSKNNFVTIDPEKFLNNMYKEIYNEKGKQQFVVTDYAGDLLNIANEMLKFSKFEQVEEDNGECYINNDLIFFELTSKFWAEYNKAMDFYEVEEFLAMCGWYNPDLTREEREVCHNTMVDLMCERTAIQNALDVAQEEKRLLTADEKCFIVSEHKKLNVDTRILQ